MKNVTIYSLLIFFIIVSTAAQAKQADSIDSSIPINDIFQSLNGTAGGPEIHQLFQTLAARKNEAIPNIKSILQAGNMWEKQKLTKFLQYSPTPEVYPELIALAQDTNEHWLCRQGALYALGELGYSSAGPEVLSILNEHDCPSGVQLVAISTLARIGYRKAIPAIKQFTKDDDTHMRLFAYRALAEFGEPIDRRFILSALQDNDYVVRQEACGVLAEVDDRDIAERLRFVADNDIHEAVRIAARIGLIHRQIRGRSDRDKLNILKDALENTDRRTAIWIIRTILDKCGPQGRSFVEQLSLRNDQIAEQANYLLIGTNNSLPLTQTDESTQTDSNTPYLPMHATTPTHQTLMEYAANKAISLLVPLSFTSTQQDLMKQGSQDEDNDTRWMAHAYNPVAGTAWYFFGGTPTREEVPTRWNSMVNAFASGNLYGGDDSGAWHFLGRVSHLLQDMSSPLHILGQPHPPQIPYVPGEFPIWPCKFEDYWQNNDSTLRSILSSIGGPLHSNTLDPKAKEKLDTFTQERLQYRFDNNCPYKNSDDARGWIDVLAWSTYFRVTYWGEIIFGTSGSSGYAAPLQTTATNFDDGYVGSKPNTLYTMFNGNVRWISGWTDDYYEITDRNEYIFRWMSWSDVDDWSSCGRTESFAGGWATGYQDSSIRIPSYYDDDDAGVRITGRFWFDTRELGKDASNHRCYPNRYPNGDTMTDDLHLYYGNYGYPLTVRYNAGLLGLANRLVTVKTNTGSANNFTWSRMDNFGNGPTFSTGTSGSNFYFVAKSSVTLTAPSSNTSGLSFKQWLKNGTAYASNQSIAINTASNWIPQNGDTYIAEYAPIGDFDNNGKEDFKDYAILAQAWMAQLGQPNWNPACDISNPKDNIIDWNDLAVFASDWLTGI